MNNTYLLKTDSIIEALDAVDTFIDKMKLFESKYKNYSHSIDIESEGSLWNVKMTIKNEKADTEETYIL